MQMPLATKPQGFKLAIQTPLYAVAGRLPSAGSRQVLFGERLSKSLERLRTTRAGSRSPWCSKNQMVLNPGVSLQELKFTLSSSGAERPAQKPVTIPTRISFLLYEDGPGNSPM